MKRQLKVSVLKMVFENDIERKNIRRESLLKIINSIRKLPTNVKMRDSRYSSSGTGNELAVVFADEIKNSGYHETDILLGIFLRRRGNNRPWEDDGSGNIIALELKDESHEVAEVSYFGIDINTGVLFFTYNPLVGGVNQFSDYLSGRINILRFSNLLESIPEDDKEGKRLGLYYIGFPDSESLFKNKMDVIKSFEFHIAGDTDFLSQAFLFENDNRDKLGIRLLREFSKRSNCANITINLRAEKAKNKKEARAYTLNKSFVIDMYENTINYLREKKDSRFNVKGDIIDEETRILDLVHSRLVYTLNVELDSNTETYKLFFYELLQLIRNKKNEVKRYYDNEVD
jgi:hypothetical protein